MICPVRNCDPALRRLTDEYVSRLETDGYHVYYPPRDADQSDDGVGLAVNESNRKAMLLADEVHVFWDPQSYGSHFDLGMAFVLQTTRDLPIVLAVAVASTPQKSYTNVVVKLSQQTA
jgi:hypothetical protein